jgi:glycosyltransferase involved in cell wall biosynthesis
LYTDGLHLLFTEVPIAAKAKRQGTLWMPRQKDQPHMASNQQPIQTPISPDHSTPNILASTMTKPPQVAGKLSVILPIYNERNTLATLLERVRAVPIEKEVLIVDDASTDGTREILQAEVEGVYPDVRVFYHQNNLGKGAAIRTAIPHITGEFCIIQDGDLEYNPEDYLPILDAFRKHDADIVYGSRFRQGRPPMKFANRMINILLAWMVRVLFHTPLTDEATCYKAFRSQVLQSIPLTCHRFEFCPEVTAKAIRRGYRIIEVPIRYTPRTKAAGKKIRWTDGIVAIWTLLKYRFARF